MAGRIATAALAAVAGLYSASAAADTVYQALGGKPGIACIIGGTIDRAVADPRIRDKFSDINIARLKLRIADHVCTLTDGPCRFHGVSLKGAHHYLHLTDAHFNALVEDMQAAMDLCGIGFWTQNRLLAILAPMEHDVVSQ